MGIRKVREFNLCLISQPPVSLSCLCSREQCAAGKCQAASWERRQRWKGWSRSLWRNVWHEGWDSSIHCDWFGWSAVRPEPSGPAPEGGQLQFWPEPSADRRHRRAHTSLGGKHCPVVLFTLSQSPIHFYMSTYWKMKEDAKCIF